VVSLTGIRNRGGKSNRELTAYDDVAYTYASNVSQMAKNGGEQSVNNEYNL
jgi:hypothetical protein